MTDEDTNRESDESYSRSAGGKSFRPTSTSSASSRAPRSSTRCRSSRGVLKEASNNSYQNQPEAGGALSPLLEGEGLIETRAGGGSESSLAAAPAHSAFVTPANRKKKLFTNTPKAEVSHFSIFLQKKKMTKIRILTDGMLFF